MAHVKYNSKNFSRNGNTFILEYDKKDVPIDTKYKIKDRQGVERNLYITSRNVVYFTTKDEDGNEKRNLVCKEIRDTIIKELGRSKK